MAKTPSTAVPICEVTGVPRAVYESHGECYCASCAPRNAKEHIMEPDEWFICMGCSFAVNMLESWRLPKEPA